VPVVSALDDRAETRVKPTRRGASADPLFHGFELAARSQLRITSYETKVAKFKRQYKTFLATYKPVGGVIRVVLVKEAHGWFAYFCTKPDATVGEILAAVADRAAIEQNFHDVKEVHGAGKQQVRNYWANIAAYHVTLWWHTLIELWAWHKPQQELSDRSASPWDDASRRPSHADRRNALRRQCLEKEFQRATAIGAIPRNICQLWKRMMKLVA
jgi:hypothetical protein